MDGTKIESTANKYTFVWKKAVEKNEKKLDEKLKVFLKDVEEITCKEDAMLNGQLKPGYNIQVGTENNFVVGYDVFPNSTDTRTFITHLKNVQNRLECKFKAVIADAGYGSEENYDYLEEKEIIGIVKYSTYEKEIKRSFKKKTFNADNWKYDAEQKEYTCPCGNPVPYKRTITKKNQSGYEQIVDVYQCENCEGCPSGNYAQNLNTEE